MVLRSRPAATALATTCFPEVGEEEFAAATHSLDFERTLPEAIVNALLAAGGTVAHTAAVGFRVFGFASTTAALSVFGAVFSSGDFLHSMLTNNPNRTYLSQIQTYLEGEAEAYRSWKVKGEVMGDG